MKIFLDVGCHTGETLDEVIKNFHKFDRIIAFEPSTVCYNHLVAKYANIPNVEILNFGLSNAEKEVELFDTGSDGASVYRDKVDINPSTVEKIKLVKAGEWILQNTLIEDVIFMKLNCEGSECDIIDDLLENGSYDRVGHLMIDFDVRKIPSQKHRQWETLARIDQKTNFDVCDKVMIGVTHQDRIANWLSICYKKAEERAK